MMLQKSLFVADEPISRIEGKETAQLIPSPTCVLKSAMQSKASGLSKSSNSAQT